MKESKSDGITLPDGHKLRSNRKPRLDKVLHFLPLLAPVAERGDAHYGPRSWQKGNANFVVDSVNHGLDHVRLAIEGDNTSEDHFAHAAFNFLMLAWFQRHKPEVVAEARRSGELPFTPVLDPVIDSKLLRDGVDGGSPSIEGDNSPAGRRDK